jgi:hypothetical protein
VAVANADRERKRNPHRCQCGSAFDVCYFDDRRDPERDGDPVTVDVSCPRCGRSRTFAVPIGSERTLTVEASESEHEDLVDEGGGG